MITVMQFKLGSLKINDYGVSETSELDITATHPATKRKGNDGGYALLRLTADEQLMLGAFLINRVESNRRLKNVERLERKEKKRGRR